MIKPSIDNVNDRIRFVLLKHKDKQTFIDKLHLKLLKKYYPNNENYEKEICDFLIHYGYMKDLNGGEYSRDEETGELFNKPGYVFNYVVTPKSRKAYHSKLFHPSEWREWFISKTVVRVSFCITASYGVFRFVLDILGISLSDFFHSILCLF